jgi:hypothetical protein
VISISFPASVAVIGALSFTGSLIETLAIDESNSHYFVSGDHPVSSVSAFAILW